MFDDLDIENDDFDESVKSKVGASGIDLDFEQGSDESGDGNFNANELLNLTDYQNKRGKNIPEKTLGSSGPQKNLQIKSVFDTKKNDPINEEDDDDWGMSGDDWGDLQKEVKLDKNELKSKNLNELNNDDLAAYKRAMDKEFVAKQLKPGDPGFVYDKVIDFSKQNDDGPMEDDSWGEDEEEVVEDQVVGGDDND